MVVDVDQRKAVQVFETAALRFGAFQTDDEIEGRGKIPGQLVSLPDLLSTRQLVQSGRQGIMTEDQRIAVIEISDEKEKENLMTAEEYKKYVEELSE